MLLPSLSATVLLSLAIHSGVQAAASDDKEKVIEPCTASSSTGAFYDLRSLQVTLPPDGKKAAKGAKTDDWTARGYDYHDNKANFTLNICGSVVEPKKDFVGVEKNLWRNVSAYYELGSKRYSIGQENATLLIRGRRLVLEYKNGSPCESTRKRAKHDDDDDDEKNVRRKSTIVSFHCDKDPLATSAIASYVGTLDDECSYHFEVLSRAACITAAADPAKQSVGPGAVFAIIGAIAVLVYFLGGVFYQRNVAHARGWRQLPNYSMWAGIGSFIKDIFIIATSSCARFMPSRRGYMSVSSSSNGGNGRGRHNRAEDENRLIDQLDEEWDD